MRISNNQGLTPKPVTIPAQTLASLDLHDGDHLSGHVSQGQVLLVIESRESRTEERPGVGFADKWYGKFKNPNVVWSNDPRAQAILNR